MCAPLWARRATQRVRLVGLRVYILGQRRSSWLTVRRLSLEQSQTSLDVDVGRIEICCSGVGVERITGLIVARLILFRR